MKKEKLLYTIISILLIIIVIMGLCNTSKENSVDGVSENDTQVSFKSLETPVEIEVLKKRDLRKSLSSFGSLNAGQQTEIISNVSGKIKKINYKEGEFVPKGAIILLLDDEQFEIEYLKAEEAVNKALAEYGIMILGGTETNKQDSNDLNLNDTKVENRNDEEALNLLKGDNRKEMLASRAGLTSARLNLLMAESNLKNTTIKAPFSGYIADLELSDNVFVKSGQVLMKLVSLNDLYIDLNVLETEILLVKEGAKAKIEIPAFPGQSFDGLVETINSIIDPESGTCRAKIKIKNSNGSFKPGMLANVILETNVFNNRLLIPRDALLIRDDRKVTFVYEKGRAKWKYIKTGLENDEYIEILDGLNFGDSLITSGHFNLAHDAQVIIVDKN